MSTLQRDIEAIKEQTVIGVFGDEITARSAVRTLASSGFSADRVGIVTDNVRQAREVAGSYSPQGAIIGALLGVLLVAAFIVFGDDSVRASGFAVALGGAPIVGGLAFIGWLAGRARVWKDDEYGEVEDDVEDGEVLVTVASDSADGADRARAILERAGAEDVRLEDTGEGV
jgi:hypothetical protein